MRIVSEFIRKKQLLTIEVFLMELVQVMEAFPTQEECISYLECLRWTGSPECPHCASTHVRHRNERHTGRIERRGGDSAPPLQGSRG